VRSKILSRIDVETRAFHGEADAAWLRLVAPGQSPSRFDYIQQLVASYGLDAPLEAALAYTPHLEGFIDVAPRFRSGLFAQDLLALGLSPSTIAGLRQCMIAPFANVAEACGWLYVHQRATLLYDAVRIELIDRLPDVADATSALHVHDGWIGMMWDELGASLDEIGCSATVEDRIIRAALEAFRTTLGWYHRPLPVESGAPLS
jgi:heme oxygenase